MLEGGPADQAGLRAGDVIVSVDGRAIGESRQLQRIVLERPVGAKLSLVIVRDKKTKSLTLVAGERPTAAQRGKGRARAPESERERAAVDDDLGVRLMQLTSGAAKQLGYEESATGALVAEVARGSAADRAGLSRGDLIVEADGKPVSTPDDVHAAMRDGTAMLRVRRGTAGHYVVLSRDE